MWSFSDATEESGQRHHQNHRITVRTPPPPATGMHPPNPQASFGVEQLPLNASQNVPADGVAGLADPVIGNSWTLSPPGAAEFASFVSNLAWEMPSPGDISVSCDSDAIFSM